MIVRDEEQMLPGLLASVAGLWDELIAVDTGSTDGTTALLAQAGARVIPFAWCDDFSAARNASLAEATGQWVLFLDADERVTPALRKQITRLLTDRSAGAATVVMRNALPDGRHHDANLLRLFRNDPAIRFRHRIHEDVLPDVESFLARQGLTLRRLDGVVEHLGYVREVAADRHKRQRDEELLRRAVTEDPADFYCWYKLLELARFWRDDELLARVASEAAPLLTGTEGASRQADLRRNPWSGALAALISQGQATDARAALAWLDRCQERVCPGAAWHLRRGLLLEELGRSAEAGAAFAECLTGAVDLDPEHRTRARLGQCRLAARAGDPKSAGELARAAADAAPTDPEALLAAVTFTNPVADFVLRHRQGHPTAGEPLAVALLGAGHAEPALDLLTELAAADPALALGQLTCALALGRDVDLSLDLDQDTADAAFQDWIRILWNSRQTKLMAGFAESCASVTQLFPWLEDYLTAETSRLRG